MQFTPDHWKNLATDVQFVPTTVYPDLPMSAAIAVIIVEGQLLLTRNTRGWDLPGGHIERGETPEQAVRREITEETGARAGRLAYIGYLHLHKTAENERNAAYAVEGAMPFFATDDVVADEAHVFTTEATEAQFVPLTEAAVYHHRWNDLSAQVIDYAAQVLQGLDEAAK